MADETKAAELTADDARRYRALLEQLRNARPLLLYGEAWLGDIERVLAGGEPVDLSR